MNCGDNQQPLVAQRQSPRSICREVCEQGTPTNQMTNYSFPLCNEEALLFASHRITTWSSSNFTVSCMHLHFIHFFNLQMTLFIYMYSQLETFQARSQLNFVTGSNSLMIQRMLTVRDLFSSLPNVLVLFKTLVSSCSISFLGVNGAQGGKSSNVWAGVCSSSWKKG